MIVKRCDIADFEEIYNIEKLSFSDPLKEDTVKKGLSDEKSFYYGLFNPMLQAYISYEKVLDEAQIISVAVHPDYRKKGLGKALFEKIIKETDDISIYTLEVRSDNKAAIGLYNALGFCEVGRRKNYYTNPTCDAILMDLHLRKD